MKEDTGLGEDMEFTGYGCGAFAEPIKWRREMTADKGKNKKYRVVSYVRAEDEDNPAVYYTKEEAEADAEHCEALQPENIYEVEEVEE